MEYEFNYMGWDKNLQKMRKVFELDVNHIYFFYEADENYVSDYEDTIILRYTGEQDKQGKDIYEGDILEITLDQGRTEIRVV